MATVDLVPGMITTRAALRASFGGSNQGGIVPIVDAKMVLVFSDPAAGAQHGYTFDGQVEDDEQGPLYLYTGAGSTGNQQLSGMNGALLRHAEMGRTVHLFVADGYVPGTGTVRQRYIGQVIVDTEQPYEERWSTSNSDTQRLLYVFRFRPAPGSRLALTGAELLQPAPDTTVLEVPVPDAPQAAGTTSTAVTTEQHTTDETTANISGGPITVRRREGLLTTAFEARLEQAGHVFHRHQITVQGEPGSLMTDVYDATDNVLYEAKGRSRRSDVRMAIGQLLDYRRHIDVPPGLRLAVLLPEEPSADVRSLLATENIHLVVRSGEGFEGFPLAATP
ncbi:hypothetical protein [Streptomyces decoyicus]|uniref:hypothetical protein n=1 Tax=Streptomyces decoyicus TaxID=249567 RepID=UPI0038709137|nr:hypothetical protein OG532_26025 [Streptomyces decoyicus]